MVSVPVQCPHCHSTEVIKAGKQANGVQRYQCQNGQREARSPASTPPGGRVSQQNTGLGGREANHPTKTRRLARAWL